MRRIKVAMIGINFYSHAQQIWKTITSRSDVFEVVGYVLPENERERYPNKMAMLEGYPELTLDEVLNDSSIDAVVIETDEIYLTKYALMAARVGKPMHMEKPGGHDLAQFEELVRTVKEKDLLWHVGYMYRYNPAISEVVKQAQAGELGEITAIDIQMGCYHGEAVQEWIGNLKGGMMFFLGCHLIDIVLRVQGMPKKITAWSKDDGRFCLAALEYENGVSTVKSCDTECGGFDRRQCVITGTKKTVEIRPLEVKTETPDEVFTEKRVYNSTAWGDRGVKSASEPMDRYCDMMLAFAAMVRGERQNPYTPDYERDLYKTILNCCEEKI
jgi:predicted dehydrogenase